MRQYVGHKMKFVVEGLGAATGVMVSEDTQMVHLKSESKDEVWHLPKGKISGFTCLDGEPDEYIPLLILSCDCKNIGCSGVKYVKVGPGFSQKDLETFTEDCPSKSAECRIGSKGELRSVPSALLKKMLNGMLFGEYPEKKKEAKRGNRSGQSVAEAQPSPTEGGGIVTGEVPADGGTGQSQETAV